MDIKIKLSTKPNLPQLYMHREDKEVFGYIRGCASSGGCPAVFVLNEPHLKTIMDKNWQYYLIAINNGMTLLDISLILDYALAFANGTGLTDPEHHRRDYILEKNLSADEDPRLDKDRTCSRNLLSGVVVGNYLRLTLFDGNKLPPMKPGKPRPQSREDIKLDDYLYNPKDHPWMFCVANRITTKPGNQTSVAPFPRGATYNWTGDGLNYTFIPHISREIVYYPLEYLIKLDMSRPLPSRYRIVTT